MHAGSACRRLADRRARGRAEDTLAASMDARKPRPVSLYGVLRERGVREGPNSGGGTSGTRKAAYFGGSDPFGVVAWRWNALYSRPGQLLPPSS